MRALRSNGLIVALGVMTGLLAAPSVGQAQGETLPLSVRCDMGNCTFPISFTDTGELADGQLYDRVHQLVVNGELYDIAVAGIEEPPLLLFGGRLVVMPPTLIGQFSVSREIYVPERGASMIRYLDVIQNTTTAARNVDFQQQGTYACCASLVDSSNEDLSLDPDDLWFVVDDTPGAGRNARTTVLAGVDNLLTNLIAESSFFGGRVNYTYSWRDVRVEGSTRNVFMTYGGQRRSPGIAAEDASDMTNPDPTSDDEFQQAITFDIDRYIDDIVNFTLTDRDDPQVRWETPRQVDEGEPFTASVDVIDPTGAGVLNWSWDLDGDGEYGELPNSTEYELTDAQTDGTANFPLSVQAIVNEGAPDERVVERTVSISIRNVAPTIRTEPTTRTTLGAPYQYIIQADDPAGDNDDLDFILQTGPDSAVITEVDASTAVLRWTPNTLDVTEPGESILFQLIVSDQDGGEDTQSWELIVLDNRPPEAPVPVFPIGAVGVEDRQPRLAVSNARDSDLTDRLVYFFELDTVDTFEGVDLRQSGPVAELPGFTFWFVEPELEPGRYFWRAQASDGSLASNWVQAEFWVVEPAVDAGFDPFDEIDAGIDVGGGGSSGCAVGGSAERGLGLVGLLGLGLALGLRRRRRQA